MKRGQIPPLCQPARLKRARTEGASAADLISSHESSPLPFLCAALSRERENAITKWERKSETTFTSDPELKKLLRYRNMRATCEGRNSVSGPVSVLSSLLFGSGSR